MKRFFVLILALLFLSSGCASYLARQAPTAAPEPDAAPVFSHGGTHAMTKEYKQIFTFSTKKNETCILNVETRIFDDNSAARLWEAVTGDLETLAANVPLEQDVPEVYVLQRTLRGRAERIGYMVYCTAEEVESGAYRKALVSAALDLDGQEEWWKIEGLISYAFGETADEEALRAYYEQADGEGMQVLSLFPAYFVDEFASEQELVIARETALLMTAYAMEKYGAEAFLKENKDYRQEWLTQLGVDRIYSDPYAEAFAGYAYTSSPIYPLIVTTDNRHVFRMVPLPGDIDTPKAVREFLYFGAEGMREILAGIEAFAPEYYNKLLHIYNQPIYYNFKTDVGRSDTYLEKMQVDLISGSDFLHETVHILLPPKNLLEPNIWNWRYEAIAEYLPYTFAENAFHREGDPWLNTCYKTLFDESAKPAVEPEYRSMLKAAYFAYAGQPENQGEVDMKSFDLSACLRALGEVTARNPQYAQSGLVRRVVSGNSYEEAYAFANYLIDKYSLSTFIRYCQGGDTVTFEEVFGIGYEEAKAEWIGGLAG